MIRRLILGIVIIASTVIPPSAVLAAGDSDRSGVPRRVIDLLAKGDLKKAIFEMRDAPTCAKTNYLMRNANRIVLLEMGEKPSRSAIHMTYQNVAIAYHNLYLFLKTRGVTQEEFAKEADSYYKKARRKGTHMHRAECDVLRAALMAAGGKVEKARRKFKRIDDMMLRADFASAEYLAVYHAAVGDLDEALASLEKAYALDPDRTLAWLDVSDDFEGLRDDPRFVAMRASWRAKSGKRDLVLSVPECAEPRLDMTGTDPFAPIGFSRKAKRQMKARKRKK